MTARDAIPPQKTPTPLQSDGHTADGNESTLDRVVSDQWNQNKDPLFTYDAVILAANGACRARVAGSNADDGDGRAAQSKKNGYITQDDTEKTQDSTSGGGAGL